MHPQFIKWAYTNGYRKMDMSLIQCKHWLESKPKEEIDEIFMKSPWYGSCAEDINPYDRVALQSIIQTFTTHSISSTINLPEESTVEDIDLIYRTANNVGLKGITVYRSGSRDGVLIDKPNFRDNHSIKRPKSLDATVVRFNNNKEKWVALIGTLDGKPYEIFTGKLDELSIPANIDNGKIVKYKTEDSKRYAFEYEGGSVDNISIIFNPDFYNYAKLVSGVLRHGMPLLSVINLVSNLSFPEDHINTWRMGVIRSLKKFMRNEHAIGLKCETCGSTNSMVFEEGCLICKKCGSSKCS